MIGLHVQCNHIVSFSLIVLGFLRPDKMTEITYTTEESFFDTEFISTKFGLVRICQFVSVY